jgi:hypothetical protein
MRRKAITRLEMEKRNQRKRRKVNCEDFTNWLNESEETLAFQGSKFREFGNSLCN